MINKVIHQIAFGIKAKIELNKSIRSIQTILPNQIIQVITDESIGNFKRVNNVIVNKHLEDMQLSRYYKTKLNEYQSEYNVYLDSDTILKSSSINCIFDILLDYDLIVCNSNNQDTEAFWHIDSKEREYTYNTLGFIPLQLQAGMFAWRRSNNMNQLFSLWHTEWLKFKDQDQAALVRALYQNPVKVYLLGKPFNSSNGSIIQHNFGRIR